MVVIFISHFSKIYVEKWNFMNYALYECYYKKTISTEKYLFIKYSEIRRNLR